MKDTTIIKSSGSGIGFSGLLTILFIALKLIGVITWSWIWVIAPIWIPCCLGLFIVVLDMCFRRYEND